MCIKMKKSQLKQTETISILFIFFILIFVVFFIYSKNKADNIQNEIREKELRRAVELSSKAHLLPEIQCSESQCIGCSGAMEMLKLDAVSNCSNSCSKLIFDSVHYFQEFGMGSIKIEITYPNKTNLPDYVNHNWTIYDRKPLIYNQFIPHYIPVNIFNPISNDCYFGVMEVAVYS